MSMPNPQITNAGRLLYLKSLEGATLHFTRIAMGDGELKTQAPASLKKLIHEVVSIPITRSRRTGNDYLSVGGPFRSSDVEAGFFYRELALYAIDPDEGEIAYCYANAFELADYIDPAGALIEGIFSVGAFVADVEHVSVTLNESLVWATQEDLAELRAEMEQMGGGALMGPASMASQLKPGGVLFVTDGAMDVTAMVEQLARVDAVLDAVNEGVDPDA